MGHVVQRFTLRISRWGATLIVGAAVLGGLWYWVSSWQPVPAELQLVALSAEGASASVVATAQRDETSGRVRFGVPLAVRNVGARSASPDRLLLSVPAYYRLTTGAGRLPSDVTPGVPLRRYAVDVAATTIPPDSVTRQLPGVDTLWIEPELPSYYCTAQMGRIPDFLPAPPRSAELLSDLRIFYSMRTPRPDERHSGLLAVRVDPAELTVEPAPMPPVFPTTFRDPEADAPVLGALHHAGSRTAYCGDPEQPLELYTVLWQTAANGNLYVVHVDGAPRKRLYDLNRDDIVELETWDVDGDGRFEAKREARFRIPEFLVPPVSRVASAMLPDTVPPDSAWLSMFHDPQSGVIRFAQFVPRTAAAPTESVGEAVDTVSPATEEVMAEPDIAGNAIARLRAIAPHDTAGATRPSRAFIMLFDDTTAGPFRFTSTAAIDSAAARAVADSLRRARRPRRTEPLGVPVPYPPRDAQRR